MKQLLGEYDVKVDAKGRLRLPSPLIRQLDGQELRFVVNRGFENCLVLYPQSVWDKITKELNGLNMYVKKNRDFVRYFLRGAAPVILDSSDRINLPKRLLEYAGIEKDAIVFANLNKIEIWNKDQYDGIWSESPSDDYADLAEDVMGNLDID
ncbi:MAG: division/cell wall cluster transcriptional repressor MraZ [Bacteroidota bacterium]